jgi:hypothetical protein
MKARALARMALRAVLVPAAVLIALVLGYGGIVRALDLVFVLNHLTYNGSTFNLPHLPWSKPALQRLETLEKIPQIAAGRDAQRCYALWQSSKDGAISRVLYATYALMLLKEDNGNLPAFERAMREGGRVDPSNALYHYLLADAYFDRAMEYTATKIAEDKRTHQVTYRYDYRLLDRDMLEKGIREFQAALAKPALRTYHTELQRMQFAALPAPRHSEDYLDRIAIAASILFPELAHFREVGRRFPYAGLILIKEGRTSEGERLLHAWKPYTEHLLGDHNPFMIHYLAAASIGSGSSETCAQQYDALGRRETAREMRLEADRRLRPYQEWRANRQDPNHRLIEQHAGMLTSILYPVGGGHGAPKIEPKELAPTRGLDQTWLEITGASGLLVLLTLAMLYVAAVTLFFSLGRKKPEERPLLILPGWRELARILGLGVLLPLIVYFAITRSGLDGRQYGFRAKDWPAVVFYAELVLLGGVLLILPLVLAKRALDYRCRALGIARPRYALPRALVLVLWIAGILIANGSILALAVWGISNTFLPDSIKTGILAAIAGMLLTGDFFGVRRLFRRLFRNQSAQYPASPVLTFILGIIGMLLVSVVVFALTAASLDLVRRWTSDDFVLIYFTVLTSVLIVCDLLWLIRFARRLFRRAPEARQEIRYPGTMARSLIFIYAMVIVFTAALVFPTLEITERALLRKDTLLLPRSGDGFSPYEAQVTDHLRQRLLASFEE